MYNKLARPVLLRFELSWWLMPSVACIIWHDIFEVFLPLISSDSVTSEDTSEKSAKKEYLQTNRQQ